MQAKQCLAEMSPALRACAPRAIKIALTSQQTSLLAHLPEHTCSRLQAAKVTDMLMLPDTEAEGRRKLTTARL